jgi:putative two-component system response regulator
VDIYDALTTDRPYRKGMSTADAFALMREEVEKGWWDGFLVDEFEAMLQGSNAVADELSPGEENAMLVSSGVKG